MNGRSPAEAVTAFVEVLQRAASCITGDVLRPERGGYRPSQPRLISFPNGSTRLRGTDPFKLSIEHWYVIEPGRDTAKWRVQTAGSAYRFLHEDGREILAYHGHPEGRSHVTTPHLRLGAGAEAGWPGLQKAHLPTGLVLPALIELAIGCGAAPRRGGWRSVVGGAREALAAECLRPGARRGWASGP